MLRWRLLAAVGILVPVGLLFWLDDQFNGGYPGIWLLPLAAAIACLGAAEVLAMLRPAGHRVQSGIVYGGCLLLILSAYAPWMGRWTGLATPWARLGLTLVAVMVTVGLALVAEMARFRQPGSSTVRVALALLVVLYIPLPVALLVHLRLLHGNRWGLLAVISIVLVVKLSDAGAYFAGKAWGRHKLTPRLSPNKTVEGAVGGLVLGCAASWLFFHFVTEGRGAPPPAGGLGWMALLYGASLVLAGMLGDLSESLLKRDLQCKDSSRWLPGLGGVLDVMDSILLAAPVGFLWWVAGGVGP